VVPYNLFLHGSALEADDEHGALAEMRLDLAVSLLLGALVTLSVLLSATQALPRVRVEAASDLALVLGPLLGPLANLTVGVGLAAAGLSSAITAPLAAAWAVDQVRGRDAENPSRAVWVPVLLVGAGLATLGLEPVPLILAAQAANALVLPLVVGACLYVANSDVLGEDANGWVANAAGVLALATTVAFVVNLW
jgi:Mn2+/Fe2+ NRAMP family transporter